MAMCQVCLGLQLLALTTSVLINDGGRFSEDPAYWLFPKHIVDPLVPCRSQGYFAHPRDCRWFYRCVGTHGTGSFRRFYFECDPNKIFVSRINKCDYVHVLPVSSSSCTSFPSSENYNSSLENSIDNELPNLIPEISLSLPQPTESTNLVVVSTLENHITDSDSLITETSKFPIQDNITVESNASLDSSSVTSIIPRPPTTLPSSSTESEPSNNAIMNQFVPPQLLPTSLDEQICVIMVGDCEHRMMCVEPLWEAHGTIVRVCLRAFYRCSGEDVSNVDLCISGTIYSPQERYCINDEYFCRDPNDFSYINPPSPPKITVGPPSVSLPASTESTTTSTTSTTTTTTRSTPTTSNPNTGWWIQTTPSKYLTTSRTTKRGYGTSYPQGTTSRPFVKPPVGPPGKRPGKPPFRPPYIPPVSTKKPTHKPSATTTNPLSIWWKPFRPTKPPTAAIPTTTSTTTSSTTTTTTTTAAPPTLSSTDTGEEYSIVPLFLNQTVRCSRKSHRPLEHWMIRYFCLEYHLCSYRGRYQGLVLLCREFLECRPLAGGRWEVARMRCPLPWLYSFDKHACDKPPAAQKLCSSSNG